jgi:hypothetical protein
MAASPPRAECRSPSKRRAGCHLARASLRTSSSRESLCTRRRVTCCSHSQGRSRCRPSEDHEPAPWALARSRRPAARALHSKEKVRALRGALACSSKETRPKPRRPSNRRARGANPSRDDSTTAASRWRMESAPSCSQANGSPARPAHGSVTGGTPSRYVAIRPRPARRHAAVELKRGNSPGSPDFESVSAAQPDPLVQQRLQ